MQNKIHNEHKIELRNALDLIGTEVESIEQIFLTNYKYFYLYIER